MEQLHITNIVKIYLILQNNNEAFPIEPHSEHRGREGEFTDGRLPLQKPDVSESAETKSQEQIQDPFVPRSDPNLPEQ